MKRALIVLAACGNTEPAPVPTVKPVAAKPVPATFDVPAPSDPIVSIGRSLEYACVVRASGGVDCWGRFGWGKPEPTPRRIPGVTDAIAINNDASAVLRKTGEVARFAPDRIELETIAGIKDVAKLGTGERGCFVLRDGKVACTHYQFGDYRVLAGVTDAVAVTHGGFNDVCALRATGDVSCGRDDGPLTPMPELGQVTRIELAPSTSTSGCAISKTGALRCFGLIKGKLTDVSDYDEKLTGFDAAMFANASELAFLPKEQSGLQSPPFELLALVNGKVAMWGPKGSRMLGTLADAKMLTGGCAVRAKGSVVCWGSNAGGVAGQTSNIGRRRRTPAPVVGASDVAKLALGQNATWAVTRAGKVLAWGEPGGGSATPIEVPAAVTDIAVTQYGNACVIAGGDFYCWTHAHPAFAKVSTGVKAISVSYGSVLAWKQDNSFEDWGVDREYTNSDPERPAPYGQHVPPPAPPHTKALVNGFPTCVLLDDGHVMCGDTGKEWSKVPIEPIVQAFDECGITASHEVRCWNTDFETLNAKPVWSPKVTDATDLGVGYSDLCIVRAGGAVWCGMREHDRPSKVIPSGAIDVEESPMHACAIMSDHTVQCWGGNNAGELGDGSIAFTNEPLGVRF